MVNWKISIVLLMFSWLNVRAQGDDNFAENAFLDSKFKNVPVYKDSGYKNLLQTIQNDYSIDKYYLIEVLSVFKNKVKVSARFTIDAGNNDKSTIVGWMDIAYLAIHHKKRKGSKNFIYSESKYNSKKINLAVSPNNAPIQITHLVRKGNDWWMQVFIRSKKGVGVYGWLSPELQCTDIWNACVGN